MTGHLQNCLMQKTTFFSNIDDNVHVQIGSERLSPLFWVHFLLRFYCKWKLYILLWFVLEIKPIIYDIASNSVCWNSTCIFTVNWNNSVLLFSCWTNNCFEGLQLLPLQPPQIKSQIWIKCGGKTTMSKWVHSLSDRFLQFIGFARKDLETGYLQ